MGFDLGTYRADAERFIEELDREYYLHMAGHKPELEIEAIYAGHAGLFEREPVERLLAASRSGAGGDDARRRRYLAQFAFDAFLGQATKGLEVESARLEAELEVEGPDGAVPFRQVPVEMANEPDAGRRAELERARDELLAEHLNPLYREGLERSHALCRELGWDGYAAAYAELRGLDFEAVRAETQRFLELTDPAYAGVLDPLLERAGLPRLGELGRADMPRFFRAAELDGPFDASRLVESFSVTMAGLGIDLASQENVHLDVEARPTKSPRAFCSPARVPDEVYLVVAPVGGREDFAALFHEGGHTEHYAGVDPALPFEFRHLGDNAVTESFAFLFDQLTETPAWLKRRLGVGDPAEIVAHARASQLLMMRRYAAKLAYEIELHGPAPDLGTLDQRYAELLGGATRVRWPAVAWLSDVDPGFYVVCYLRAWALEALWRRSLVERFGELWFEEPAAGEWLRSLWREGQRLGAEELAERELGATLDFAALADELVGDPATG